MSKEYDINRYTDSELYDILDLVNPTDIVLEAKIVQMINRYNNIQNDSGKRLSQFFRDIYDRFFMPEEEDYESEQIQYTITEGFDVSQNPMSMSAPTTANVNATTENVVNTSLNVNTTSSGFTASQTNINKLDTVEATQPNTQLKVDAKSNNQSSFIVDYKKDTLNPLLKQTIKRIISIDSQYRELKTYPLSSEFTFNLSEPLKDVVALRLYSVQIPYTWWTINKDYGGSFFYIKGNSPGIDTGEFDISVNIASGNYDPAGLVTTVNNSITRLKNTYTDLSFGTTNMVYNNYTNFANITVDIRNLFTESDYRIEFNNNNGLNVYPDAVDSEGTLLRYPTSIPSDMTCNLSCYLGFNSLIYNPNHVYSAPYIGNTVEDSTITPYFVDPSANYFTIIRYIGPSEYNENTSIVDLSATVVLDVTGLNSRNSLIASVNRQLASNPLFSNSSITLRTVTDVSMANYGYSYFDLNFNWNRYKVTNATVFSMKTCIKFPQETNTSSRVWVKDPSNNVTQCCFNFGAVDNNSNVYELNNIMGESYSGQTNYIINSSPYIVLKCIKPNFTSTNNYSPASIQNGFPNDLVNDIVIRVENSTNTIYVDGYTLDQYIQAINDGFTAANVASQNIANPYGTLILPTSKVLVSDRDTNDIEFRIDITKIFKNDSYLMDISASDLYNFLNIGKDLSSNGVNINLATNNQLAGQLSINRFPYQFTTAYIATIRPNINSQNNGNRNDEIWHVYSSTVQNDLANNTGSYTYIQVQNIITQAFQDFTTTDGSKPLTNTTILLSPAGTNINVNLNMVINKILTQTDYDLYFYDSSSNSPTGWDNTSSWYVNLKMVDPSYNLATYSSGNVTYADIFGIGSITGYTYFINKEETLLIRGVNSGVVTADGTNDILITIPPATSSSNYQYTRKQIFDIINGQFNSSANQVFAGSSIYTKTINGIEYVNIRLNINKLYTAKDYRLVFYDPYSFVKCFVGAPSVRNVTWDSTLGWILGFRTQSEYNISEYITADSPIANISGDTAVSTNLYNYFLIVIDDYTQSHINDGLITLTPQETDISLPSYATRSTFQCDTNGNQVFTGSLNSGLGNGLTQAQIYAANQINNARAERQNPKIYSTGPFTQDIFGLVPMKVNGLANGAYYIEFGGTLQQQERLYFGPVNIRRMTIKLMNDKGDTVDLNGANWSFSFVCEQLYQQKSV